jgi:hypothetical protein
MTVDRLDIVKLLVSGGDDRLALDAATGVNMYGYGALPRPADLAFSSSTASTISPRGFAAAAALFDRLAPEIATRNAGDVYARETDVIRDRLRHCFGLDEATDVVLAASGTDLHLIVASLLHAFHRRPVLTLALTGSETGSGVGLASAGRHPMTHTVSSRSVVKGEPLRADGMLTSIAMPVRDASGDLRPEAEIAAALCQAIETAIAEGKHCILVATDVSKTGLIAPELATVFALKAHFGAGLDLLVDACQLRVTPETIRAYLAKGCLVAVTGSKFVAGPIFSGALIVPGVLADALKAVPLGDGLGDYSGADDWPADWQAAKSLPNRRNFGLVLRWQAALVELEAMLARHPLKLGWVAMRFGEAVEAHLKADPRFEPVPGRRLDRSALGLETAPDVMPTIFPFMLQGDAGLLSADETLAVYSGLASCSTSRPAIRLGQPVAIGMRDGQSVAALRLCLSAPLMANACDADAALDRLIADALFALDCAADVAQSRVARVA